jgi:thioredoxin-like negative regulator of GroEL
MSTIVDITDTSTFTSHVSSLSPVTLLAVSFHTPWAAPCAQMRLILETLAASYPPETPPIVSFISINAESLPEISETYDVTAVPFLVLQKEGKILESISGSDASKVRDAVERHAGKGANRNKYVLPPALEATPRVNGESAHTAKTDFDGQAPSGNDPTLGMESSTNEGQGNELYTRLEKLVKAAPVMLFMKGTPSAPQCGFSRKLVGLLRERGVQYGFFNILADEDVRQGLKEFSYEIPGKS